MLHDIQNLRQRLLVCWESFELRCEVDSDCFPEPSACPGISVFTSAVFLLHLLDRCAHIFFLFQSYESRRHPLQNEFTGTCTGPVPVTMPMGTANVGAGIPALFLL
jgi:hypothetical protein